MLQPVSSVLLAAAGQMSGRTLLLDLGRRTRVPVLLLVFAAAEVLAALRDRGAIPDSQAGWRLRGSGHPGAAGGTARARRISIPPFGQPGDEWAAVRGGRLRHYPDARRRGVVAVGAVHIAFLVGGRNRATVLVEWLWAYLTFHCGTRLITGRRPVQCSASVGQFRARASLMKASATRVNGRPATATSSTSCAG